MEDSFSLEAQVVGYRQCVLGTDEKNSRALVFYANYGFRVTHFSYSYEKKLDWLSSVNAGLTSVKRAKNRATSGKVKPPTRRA